MGTPEAKRLAENGTRAVLKMIFNHNFIHGDLHPGNIFWTQPQNQLAYLDAGLVVELGDQEHSDMSNVLQNFIRYKGYDAAKIMIKSSEAQKVAGVDPARDEETFRPETPVCCSKAD